VGLFSKEKIREEISKEKVKKKDKWGNIQYKQANNIYGAKIENQIKGALRPADHTGLHSTD